MKIHFKYSSVFDELLSEMSLSPYTSKQKNFMLDYVDKLNKDWGKDESKIMKEIEKVSGMKFKYEKIPCFVVKNMGFEAISYPLTIKALDIKKTKQVLIHELIHVILKDDKKLLSLLGKIKADEEEKVHLPVLLVQRKVTENLYGKKAFDEFLNYEFNDDLEDSLELIKKFNDFEKNVLKYLKRKI